MFSNDMAICTGCVFIVNVTQTAVTSEEGISSKEQKARCGHICVCGCFCFVFCFLITD